MTATHRILLAVCLVVWTAPWAATAARAATIEIRLVQTPDGKAYFDPVGVHIVPGDTVRWIQVSGFHSVTAYHPGNDDHELRIPSSAEAWDSDILLGTYPQHGALYERVFTVPGVYDDFCKPHELAGISIDRRDPEKGDGATALADVVRQGRG